MELGQSSGRFEHDPSMRMGALSNKAVERLRRWLEQHVDEMAALLADFIAIPTAPDCSRPVSMPREAYQLTRTARDFYPSRTARGSTSTCAESLHARRSTPLPPCTFSHERRRGESWPVVQNEIPWTGEQVSTTAPVST